MNYEGFDFVEESGGIRNFRLKKNGLQVLLVEQKQAPVVACMITYRVGSRHEGAGETGATHFLEHLMFKGTDRFNKRKGTSIFSTLQSLGARVNATTWFDRTNYYELLPDDRLDVALEIEADRMRGASLLDSDIESERTVILNEFDRAENQPGRKLYHAVWNTAFSAHAYRHPTIGWRSDIENFTSSDLRSFYDRYYWPDNATLSIVGNRSEADALSSVLNYFGDIPSSSAEFAQPVTIEPEQIGPRMTIVYLPGTLGSLLVAYKSPSATDPDTIVLSVIATLIGAGKTSRLYRALVETGIATGVSASTSMLRDPGLFSVYIMLSAPDNHGDAMTIIEDHLSRLESSDVEESELAGVKSRLKSESVFAQDGAFSVVANLNEAIAAGDWKLYPNYIERMLQVSASDIRRVAKKYLVENTRTTGEFRPLNLE